jgi:hypothetical protein
MGKLLAKGCLFAVAYVSMRLTMIYALGHRWRAKFSRAFVA